MRINWDLLYANISNLAEGAGWTIFITVFALVMGMILGLLVAIMRLSKRVYLRYPAVVYVEILRCTPMLLQIFMLYFGIIPGVNAIIQSYPAINETLVGWGLPPINLVRNMPAVAAGIIALGFNSGAYLAEIFRGGILSIDKGQREAALSLGMTEGQSMFYVVLPQALTNSLPAMGNEFVTLLKDSSLVSAISVNELLFRAQAVGSSNFEYFTMLLGAGIGYFIMCFSMSRALAYYEKRRRVGYH